MKHATARRRPAEFADAAHLEVPEPPAKRLGFSDWNFGDQRFGDAEERHDGFAEAGREGEVALALLLADGGIESCTFFSDIQHNETIGDEPEPSDGFERGVRVHVKERN